MANRTYNPTNIPIFKGPGSSAVIREEFAAIGVATGTLETDVDAKIPLTYLDTDSTLAADSDTKVATQKATKAYAVAKTQIDTDVTLAANSDVKVASQKAVKAFVAATAFSTELPAQTGNAGKFVTTDGTNASWEEAVTPTGTQTLTSKTYTGPAYTRDDDGTISGGTWAIDYANGPVIKATAGANITSITMSNWPATGTAGHLRLMLVNFGAYTITFPAAWNWIKSDLSVSTTFADIGLTLPSTGTALVDLFSDDGGTTVYATVGRN